LGLVYGGSTLPTIADCDWPSTVVRSPDDFTKGNPIGLCNCKMQHPGAAQMEIAKISQALRIKNFAQRRYRSKTGSKELEAKN
jgi:hypothetical protein